jgi:hypothetical protein
VKYNQVQKYPPKLLVWLAISPKGTTKPWYRKSGIAINQNTYLEILKERLVPFIRRYYRSGGYVFWPDVASAHYAVKVQNYLKEMKIPVIPKDMNPANVPKARPIEDFWANLKAEVYKGDWKATTLKELENRIKLCTLCTYRYVFSYSSRFIRNSFTILLIRLIELIRNKPVRVRRMTTDFVNLFD